MDGHNRNGLRSFSLRILCLATAVVATFFALYSHNSRRIRKHHYAIRQIQLMGAHPVLTTPIGRNITEDFETTENLLQILSGTPSVVVVSIDMSAASVSEDAIRGMIPHMKNIIPSSLNDTDPWTSEPSSGYVLIDAQGNGSFNSDLVDTMRSELPNYRFSRFTPLPDGSEQLIHKGMSATEVVQTVGQKMFAQRTDWVGDTAPIVEMLGSSMHRTFPNTDGTITWTYATDEIGIGTLVIDFDTNQRVVATSLHQGTPSRLAGRAIKQGYYD